MWDAIGSWAKANPWAVAAAAIGLGAAAAIAVWGAAWGVWSIFE